MYRKHTFGKFKFEYVFFIPAANKTIWLIVSNNDAIIRKGEVQHDWIASTFCLYYTCIKTVAKTPLASTIVD